MILQENFDVLQAKYHIATQNIIELRELVLVVTNAVNAAMATANENASVTTSVSVIVPVSTTRTKNLVNPFNGDINLTTSDDLKLYQVATAVLIDTSNITATAAKTKAFIDTMRDDSTKFSWGTLVSNIGPNKKQILHDFTDLNLNVLRKTMHSLFSTTQTLISHLRQNQKCLRLILIPIQQIKSSSLREFVTI